MRKLDSLSAILQAIKNEEISCGMNKEYCFVTNEDGQLVFLKRDLGNPYYTVLDKEGNRRRQWPYNSFDGEVLWSIDTYHSRGLEITELFLDALGIDYQG